jgi:hypothetical protein
VEEKSTLIEVLNKLPMLKVLDISEIYYFGAHISLGKVHVQLVELSCESSIVDIFKCNTLQKLSLFWRSLLTEDITPSLVPFVKQQKNLKTLELNEYNFGHLFPMPDILDVPFSLIEFKFCSHYRAFLHHEQLIKFLALHKATLTRLEVDFFTEPDIGIDLIHKLALENLPNLKYLTFGKSLDAADGFVMRLNGLISHTKIRHIESLKFSAFSTNMNENVMFLDMFTNLKHLDLTLIHKENYDSRLMKGINASVVNLESLSIGTLWFDNDITIFFPKIKKFQLNFVFAEVVLSSFINRHSKTLESITFGSMSNLTELTIKELIHCDNLRHIAMWNTYDENALSKMKSLQEVILKMKRIKIVLTHQITKVFNFPDDKALWDERIADLEIYYEESHRVKRLKSKAFSYC